MSKKRKGDPPIDLTNPVSFDLFQAIGDRLRAEGKLRPFPNTRLLYDTEGALLGKLEEQDDGSWSGRMRHEGAWWTIAQHADGPITLVEIEPPQG